MSNTAPSRADPVVVFPISRWCPPQETSQPHPPHWNVWIWIKISHSRKSIWKGCLLNGGHFVSVSFDKFWAMGKPTWGKWATYSESAQLQVYKTLNGLNPSSGFRDPRSEPSSGYRDMGSARLAATRLDARPPARTGTTIPLQPRGLWGKIYLYFLSCLNTMMARVVEVLAYSKH